MNIRNYLYQRRVKRLKRKIAGVKAKLTWWLEIVKMQTTLNERIVEDVSDMYARKAELEEELNQLVNG